MDEGVSLTLVHEGESRWQVRHDRPGRLRVVVPELLERRAACAALQARLLTWPGISRVDVSPRLGSVTIRYRRHHVSRRDVDGALLDGLDQPEPLNRELRPLPDVELKLVVLLVALAATPLLPRAGRLALTVATITPSLLQGVRELRQRGLANKVQDAAALLLTTVAGRFGAAQISNLMHVIAQQFETRAVVATEAGLRQQARPRLPLYTVRRGTETLRARAAQLCGGDCLTLEAGDVVPLDAMVLDGAARATHGFTTREFAIRGGDSLPAGSILREGRLELALLQSWSEGTLAHLEEFVEAAIQGRESADLYSLRLADRLAPYSILVAAAVYGFTRDLARSSSSMQADFGGSLNLSTPVAIEAAIAAGANCGLLFRSGAVIERVAAVDTIVFDRSGTLTAGDWSLQRVVPQGRRQKARAHRRLTEVLLRCCRRAVLDAAAADPPLLQSLNHAEVQLLGEQGVQCRIGGRNCCVLEQDLAVQRFGIEAAAVPAGGLGLCLFEEGQLLARFEFGSALDPEAQLSLAALRAAGVSELHMITQEAPERLPEGLFDLGLDSIQAGLDEVGKLRYLNRLQKSGRRVALVSDGLLHAPGECLNICFSNGLATRQIDADVWILRAELPALLAARTLAQETAAKLQGNQRINVVANGAVLLAASFDLLPPALAALLSNGVTLGLIERGRRQAHEVAGLPLPGGARDTISLQEPT